MPNWQKIYQVYTSHLIVTVTKINDRVVNISCEACDTHYAYILKAPFSSKTDIFYPRKN